MKFYGGEDSTPDEPISRLEENGWAAGRLQREGCLLMRPEEDPLGKRKHELGRLVDEKAGEGRTVWASFDRVEQVDLETLEQQEGLAKLVDGQFVVMSAAFEEAIEGWPSAEPRSARSSHSGTILASGSELSLSRATPMPAP